MPSQDVFAKKYYSLKSFCYRYMFYGFRRGATNFTQKSMLQISRITSLTSNITHFNLQTSQKCRQIITHFIKGCFLRILYLMNCPELCLIKSWIFIIILSVKQWKGNFLGGSATQWIKCTGWRSIHALLKDIAFRSCYNRNVIEYFTRIIGIANIASQ